MLHIRRFRPDDDAAATARLFHASIREGAVGAYSEEQLAAWAPAPPETAEWAARLGSMTTLIAVELAASDDEEDGEGDPLGFMSLTDAGHIDLAYVRPDRFGTGVSDALYNAVLSVARTSGLRRLTTDASHLARRFFEKRGWHVLREQRPVRHGIALTNFRMVIDLDG
ncbi:GNAT family N-acetyltransferase [Marivibrio halodurans]|uniref:GNAT family N-acetyltransferase n=1 Tax=Marivibrio halodurans TaxID=2039722 RepID=A0A8J7SLB7_9PROT|nr:GNAT family N-acetyltransferase [Marivibrio halodurans]MBP5856758.1 GNAT family N-acetyltransferase [Marivibrio halodurans]